MELLPGLFVATLAVTQCLEAAVLPIRYYTSADGLAADHIDCIVPDSHGFIWFCTPDGLTRFDGYRMTIFGMADGLPRQGVTSFLETRAGAYLVGTNRGLSQFHTSAGGNGFVNYRQGTGPFDHLVTALLESSSGRIWCGTGGGLFEVQGASTFRPQPLLGLDHIAVTDLKEDTSGRLWVATDGGIIILAQDGTVERITKPDGLPSEWVEALLLDRSGRRWAGTRNGLVLLGEDARGRFGVQRVYTDSDGLPSADIKSLGEGPDGVIWVGTMMGIGRLAPGSGAPMFQSLTRANGLSDRTILALAMDRSGDMWAATEGAGVMRIGSAGFVTFREQDGLTTDRVFSVFADRTGTVIAVSAKAVGRSLNVFDPAHLKFHSVVPKVFGDNAGWGDNQLVLQARTGDWWVATKVGLCRFGAARAMELAGRQPAACYAPDIKAFRVFEDSKGGIWASAQSAQGDRLLRWDPARRAISWFEDGPHRNELVTALAEDSHGNIWMGASRGDLFRYDGKQFTRFKQKDGVPAGAIGALLVDHSGRLWIGSMTDGLGLVEDPGSAPFHARHYDVSSGLSSSRIFCLVEDSVGRIYAGTGRGVDRLDPARARIQHLSYADGLAHGRLRSALRDGSGNLWFATNQGLSRLTPTASRPRSIPSVRITSLKIFGRPYPVSQAGEVFIRPPKLDPSRNQLLVEFAGFNDEPEENLRYTYKLEGSGSDWKNPPDRNHEANYPGLAPGHYHFLVKAVNSEDKDGQPAEIDFVVAPPFWRTWWFETLSLALVASLVLLAYKLRMQEATARVRLRYEERLDERTRIARELHDTLLQSLAGISLQLDGVAKQVGPSSETAAVQIGDVRRQVEASFREARQKVQDLRSPILEGRCLSTVLRESLEQIAAGHPVRLSVIVTGEPPVLRDECGEAVLRIGQEAVFNAVRHAHASEIQVYLEYGEGSLRLSVRDNGQGFELEDARHRMGHWGLQNMQERAQGLGAQFKIASAAGSGTEIETVVPLTPGK